MLSCVAKTAFKRFFFGVNNTPFIRGAMRKCSKLLIGKKSIEE